LAYGPGKIEKIDAMTFERTDFVKDNEDEDVVSNVRCVCADEVNGLVWFMNSKQQIFKADINQNEFKEIEKPWHTEEDLSE
jgi:hypothetical protein